MIEKAIKDVLDSVIDPALNNRKINKDVKAKIKSTKTLLNNFRKIGDLYTYLSRFKSNNYARGVVFQNLEKNRLMSFESFLPLFKKKYKPYLNDVTKLDDFKIGFPYTSFDIAIFSKTYNNQAGIYLINEEAIFIKVTLEGGKYSNTWIKKNEELKYYMQSRSGNFNENYKANQAIINSENKPIYVFIKNGAECILNGIYHYQSHHTERDGAKWFLLTLNKEINPKKIVSLDDYEKEFEQKVLKSSQSNRKKRLKRINSSPKKPEKFISTTISYYRNPDIIVERLLKANGHCEKCKKPAPFLRKSDNSPYLEVHHITPLSKNGEDTIDNTIALCPNCHRKAHFG